MPERGVVKCNLHHVARYTVAVKIDDVKLAEVQRCNHALIVGVKVLALAFDFLDSVIFLCFEILPDAILSRKAVEHAEFRQILGCEAAQIDFVRYVRVVGFN